jgi:HAD superfamily hydrolase (TIGR01509 family)
MKASKQDRDGDRNQPLTDVAQSGNVPPFDAGDGRAVLEGAAVALFDFDGVIADTEVHQLAAYRELLTEMGHDLEPTRFMGYMGRSEPEIYALLRTDLNVHIDDRSATARRLELFFNNIRHADLEPFPVIVSLLRSLRQRGIGAHIVSSNEKSTIESLLGQWNLRDLIDEIYTVNSTEPPLPKIEILGDLPRQLKISPDAIVLFEDSARVVNAARALGMRTVGVRHSLNERADLQADFELRPLSSAG